MGINYLGSNSQTQLKMLLDNILKRFRAKKVAESIEENVWKISKFFYNNEPSFYKNFGTTENEKNVLHDARYCSIDDDDSLC